MKCYLRRRPAFLVFIGVFLAQAAWTLSVPAYEAIDEFDHAYRAASVADGQWRPSETAQNGRGLLVVVSEGMVSAASRQCDSLPYTGPDNCFPVEFLSGDRVSVASAAASYNPVYYWLVGTAAQPFDGEAAVYAMRIASGLLCALGIGFSMWCLGLGRAGPWTRFGLLASLTPVLIYTTMIPAPNSIEIVAGLCVWTSLLTLGSVRVRHDEERVLLLFATIAGCVVAVPRMLGPLWLAFIVALVIIFAGTPRVRDLVARHRHLIVLSVAVQGLAVAFSGWWTISTGLTASPREIASMSSGVALDAENAIQPLAWILQTVGAFPFRDQPAPTAVYVLVLLIVGSMLVAGLRRGRGRERLAIGLAVVLTLAIPLVLSYLTAEAHGAIWQGRYGLPLVVGILVMCGLVLDREDWAPTEKRRLVTLGCVMLTTGHVWSVGKVAMGEGVVVALISGTLMSLAWFGLASIVFVEPGHRAGRRGSVRVEADR